MDDEGTMIEDGRRARRARNRDAVIEALFDLLTEGDAMPGIEAVAERAGVSVSSVFRYFDGLEDLKQETIEHYFSRYATLFAIPQIGKGDLTDRIEAFVDARLRLYDAIAPIGRLARSRAYDQPTIAKPLARARSMFVEQIHSQFAAELQSHSVADRAELTAVIDSITSFEGWELSLRTHRLSRTQVASAWAQALDRLLTS